MSNNLQPQDYAYLSSTAAQLKQEIASCPSFQELMREEKFPGYTVGMLLRIVIEPQQGSLDSAAINVLLDEAGLPDVEPEPEDENEDDVPY